MQQRPPREKGPAGDRHDAPAAIAAGAKGTGSETLDVDVRIRAL